MLFGFDGFSLAAGAGGLGRPFLKRERVSDGDRLFTLSQSRATRAAEATPKSSKSNKSKRRKGGFSPRGKGSSALR